MSEIDNNDKLGKLAEDQELKKDFEKLDIEEKQDEKMNEAKNENSPYIKDLPFIREGENNQFDNPNGEVGFK